MGGAGVGQGRDAASGQESYHHEAQGSRVLSALGHPLDPSR